MIVRRVLEVPVVLFIVSAAVFWLVQVVPGDPGRAALGQFATQAQINRWKAANGLDGSTLERYGQWLGGFVSGHLGTSLSYNAPVASVMWPRFGNSVLLGIYAFVLIALFGIALGLFQAIRRGTRLDQGINVALVSLSSIPEFATGSLLLVLFAVGVPLFPVHSEVDASTDIGARLVAMTMPAIALAVASIGYVARMVRTQAVGSLESQFYRTAVLKGLSRRRIVRAHLLRNSLVPSVAVLGGQLAYLVAGNVIVETLFSYPGIGALIVDSVQKKDLLVLESAVMVTATASILLLLVADLVNLALDPRIDLSPRSRR
ncbi:ABC transporter permease [Frondihabitans peucedani]|uniref:ABC transporter permease n=1 Tax=Frondihabitans peucedani TaxID=598626 RepID=A0ABP8E1D8_9MICO